MSGAAERLQESMLSSPFAGAWISDRGVYRYALWRRWDAAAPMLVVCMLNPSTADASKDDPTIRRLVSFADRDGYGAILVVNLYAYRTAHPTELRGRPYEAVVGPENNDLFEAAITQGSTVLLGWGAADWQSIDGDRTRRNDVIKFVSHAEAIPVCLGLTASGEPRHPLYVRGDVPFQPYAGAL